MKTVIKRDGVEKEFDSSKIKRVIKLANNSVEKEARLSEEEIDEIVESVVFDLKDEEIIEIERIQDLVEKELSAVNFIVGKAFILKREERNRERRKRSGFRRITKEKLTASNVQNSNANVDEFSFGGRMGEAASELAKQVALDEIISEQTRKNHANNEIYLHDLSSYAVGDHNCLSCPIDDLLANGFNNRQTDIRPAGSLNTAFQLVAVLFQIQSLQQFGGVASTHIDWTMVPYFRKSFMKYFKDGLKYVEKKSDKQIEKIVEKILRDE